MNAYERFEAILKRVEFRDWRFILGVEGVLDNERYYLQVAFDAPDATSDAAELVAQKGRKWFLSQHMTRSEIVSTALAAVLAATEHEAREDFLYRGEAVFGPHFDVESLYVLATMKRLDARQAA